MTSPYLKMRASSAATDNGFKSVDFSELLRPPRSHPQPRLPWTWTEKTGWNNETLVECHDDEIKGDRFGTVLGIRRSVSSPTDLRKGFQLESKCHDDEINGERFGTVLGIRRSVSSPTDPRKGFQLESKQKVGKYSAVKRVFSMRRSASVSERYCRIHDQSDTPSAYFQGENSMDEETGSPMKPVKQQQHKGGKIIKACKRLFNLK